ncbi:MAG: hypothetical protein J0L82_06130 [Deltaproteobacteria bacterium]|nr:hypothetical protein [Deltaproteobacteria bacterium]
MTITRRKFLILFGALVLSLASNIILFVLLDRGRGPGSGLGTTESAGTASEADNAFKDFETVAFAREFAERFASFESESFRSTQTALSFLLEEKERSQRLEEVDRISEKLVKKSVTQRGRLMRLARRGEAEDAFQADLLVDLLEGASASPSKNQFRLKLSFDVKKVERTAQNPWGFLIGNLRQEVMAADPTELGSRSILVRPQSPVLLRFPCVIENVELPKGTPIRVRLTTLDVSELQMRTDEPLFGEHKMRAVCRDRAYRVSLSSDLSAAQGAYPLTSIQSYTIAQSETAKPMKNNGPRRAKSAVEKSIEEQLGFVIEAE